MRAFVLEGTPAEVAAALKALDVSSSEAPPIPEGTSMSSETTKTGPEEGSPAGGNDNFVMVSVGLARKVLKRRGLAPLQRKMLLAIYNAGPRGILGSELATELGYNQAQFRGMMGAWGRRVTNTPGSNGHSHFFNWQWEDDASSYRYSLPDSVREAIRIELIDKK